MTNSSYSRKLHRDLLLDRGLLITLSLDEEPRICNQYRETLTPEELARSRRLVTETLQRRFIVMRGRLREVLGAFLDTAPSQVVIDQGDFGKPRLGAGYQAAWCFNVTHSGERGAIAIQRARWLGVDLEQADPSIDVAMLATELLSATELSIWRRKLAHDTDIVRFLRAWVAKEAIVKALGVGMAEGLPAVTLADAFLESPEIDFFAPQITPELVRKLTSDKNLQEKFSCEWRSLRVRLFEAEPGFFMAVCSDSNLLEFLRGTWGNFMEDSFPDCC